jgi:hypothetical protein
MKYLKIQHTQQLLNGDFRQCREHEHRVFGVYHCCFVCGLPTPPVSIFEF